MNSRLRAVLVFRKQALADAAGRCELFRPAWDLLADTPETGSWLCLPEPPDEEWARHHEELDDELYAASRHKALDAN